MQISKQEKAISKASIEPMEENTSYTAVYFLFLDNRTNCLAGVQVPKDVGYRGAP